MSKACSNCRFFELRHQDDEAMARAAVAGHPRPPGQCRRYPTTVARGPDDWCGEWHPVPEPEVLAP